MVGKVLIYSYVSDKCFGGSVCKLFLFFIGLFVYFRFLFIKSLSFFMFLLMVLRDDVVGEVIESSVCGYRGERGSLGF